MIERVAFLQYSGCWFAMEVGSTSLSSCFAEFVQSHNLYRSPPIEVGHMTLFSSQLSDDHPAYTAEVEYELGAAPAP